MSSRDLAAGRASARTWAIPWVLLSYLAVGLAALLPRVVDLGRWLSGDEASFWLRRSQIFLDAIRTGDYAATAITTHPGVTTMWLGSAGLVLHQSLIDWRLLHDFSFPMFLAIVRLPTALAHVAGVLAGYALLRRMFAPAVAALAALLWALDPFVIAFSRVLHVDALPATFITVSLLAACIYWYHDRRTRWLVFSAVVGGLALLSKSPSFALLPMVGLVALLGRTKDEGPKTRPRTKHQRPTAEQQPSVLGPWSFGLWSMARPLLVWGLLAGLTVFALWPALWVGPAQAYRQVRLGIEAEGASPHMLGNFFLGRQDDSPGALFYPVALALRLTPWAMIGLLALPFVWRRAKSLERRDLAMLAGFAILFVVAMSAFPKKFDRYLVPMFPAVDILAAFGLIGIADLGLQLFWPASATDVAEAGQKEGVRGAQPLALPAFQAIPRIRVAVLSLVVLLAVLNAAYWHPYGIAAFNQLLGGATAGARTFAIGWGEGLSEAADWLNQQPDIADVRVAATMTTGLQSYLRTGAQAVVPDGPELPPATGYIVVYARNVQWDPPRPPFAEFYDHETPAHVVRIHDINYAWIYRAPPPSDQLRQADFGSAIHLRGYSLVGAPERGKPLVVHLVWKARKQLGADSMLFAHLIGADGQTYARIDLPYQTSAWPAGHYQQSELVVPLPVDLPAGAYRLVIGLYDPNGGRRLALGVGEPIDPALDGPDALPLMQVKVE
jgi:4-amino-4-deoxy-L-arabinose transferase-like glycosyltransferase